jgi:hypothetical protein
MRTKFRSSILGAVLASTALVATACPTTPGTPVVTNNWTFTANRVQVNDSQDEVCVLFCVNQSDEAYVLNINFRVKVGVANSATGWVTGDPAQTQLVELVPATPRTSPAASRQLRASTTSRASIILDLLDANNKLEVWGSYAWAAEEDTVGIATAANDVASILKDAMNSTLANASLPSDPNLIVEPHRFSNIGNAITLLASNIPLFGLGDDVLGGGLYVGIGAKGALGAILDATAGTATIGPISIPLVDLPPDIDQRWAVHHDCHEELQQPGLQWRRRRTRLQLLSTADFLIF